MASPRGILWSCVGVCAATAAIVVVGRASLRARSPRLSVSRFVAFGDSLTKGVLDVSVPVPANASYSYPSQLAELLTRRYSGQNIQVINEGHTAETTKQGFARLPSVLDADKPEVLLLLEGTNDLVDEEKGIDPSIDNLGRMIDLATSRGVRTLVATLPPQREGGSRAWDSRLVPAYNARLARTAQKHGWHLVPVDRGFDDVALFVGPDGLHPSVNGYLRIAEAFFDAIHVTFESRPRANVH